MRKFTLFLSFVFAFLTASAQEVTVTSLDQLSNDKTYFIESARCFLMYNTTANADGISTSTATNLGTSTVAKDWTDANQQFKIENIDGSYYLYSVGAAKYVTSNGGFSDTATDALGLTPASDATYNWKLTIGGNGMNSQEPGQMAAGIIVNNWTTEDPGNRYKIIDAEASTVVVIDYPNEFSEFDQNKCYTVTTTSRGGWAVANDAFCSTNDASLGTASNPADANQQFAVLSNDGENYYLYSVGAKKFVKSDKSLIAGRGEAIELADASSIGECRVRVNFKGYTDKYINLGGGKQMIIDNWSAIDAGNAVAFIEAGDFDPTEALAMLNNVATITYKFQYEGNVVATQEVVAVPGEAYPDYTLSAPYGVTGAAKPEGIVSSDETVTIELTITKALPFEAVAEGEPTKWYYAQIHGNFLSYMTNPGVGAEMPWKVNGELITAVDEANADNYTWGFVGNLWTGFKVVSKAGGAIKSTGSGNITIVENIEDATAFIAMAPITNDNAAAETGFCLLNAEAGQYINAQNVGVNHWTANDAGSTIVVTEREITVEPEPEVPFKVVSYTPTEAVAELTTVTVEFSEEIAGEQNIMDTMNYIYVGSKTNACNFTVDGKVLTITLWTPITATGEYALYVPAGVGITRASNGEAVTVNGEIKFTVEEPAAEFEVVAVTPSEAVTELNTITIEFSEEIAGEQNIMDTMNYIYVGSKTNACNFTVDGKVLTITLWTPITAAGEYALYVPAGVGITRASNGEAVTVNGEIKFTVEEAAIEYDNIADIAEDVESTIKGTVIATYSKGFLVQDETGMVLVYLNAAHEYVAGDVVTVNGVVTTYGGLLQFPKESVVEKTGESATVEYPTATVMDGAALDAFLTAPVIQYVEYTGTLTINGSYYNVAVEGATTAMGSIQYPNTGLVTASTGDVVKVTGYTIGVSSSKYVNTMAVAVEVVEEAPDVEIPEYTVTEALAAYVEGSPAQVTVTGYIVGSVDSKVTNAAFGADATIKTNMLISDNPYTTDVTECLVIQLPSGDLRNKLNIVDNPANYRAEVVVTGSLEKYCGAAGVKNLTHGELTGNVAPEPAKPTLNETVVFDFVNGGWNIPTMEANNYSSIKTAGEYTDGAKTINIDPTANGGSYIYDNKGFLNISKPGTKIILPAFGFAVEKIEVVGHSSATSYPNVDMNVFVGGTAVSTACIGSTETYTYEIAADNQAAGNVYELVIGSNGGNYSSVMYITYIKVYPAENKLEAPVIDLASGVYVGAQTVNVHSETADIEGVTNVTYYYTTNGNEPTVEDEETDGEITIENSCTLKVIVELTYGDKTYVSASTSAEYIISEAVTYHRAVAVESGSYFLAANGHVAAPLANGVLPGVETTIDGNDLTEAAYYAITLEEAAEAGTYYIKDVNGNYIYTSSMYGTSGPKLSSNGAHIPMSSWTITVADDENSTATIVSEGLTLVYDTVAGAFKVTESVSSDMALPTLYGTKATGIENAVINGEAIESIYDLQGRKLEKVTEGGIYIVNGKKILVK